MVLRTHQDDDDEVEEEEEDAGQLKLSKDLNLLNERGEENEECRLVLVSEVLEILQNNYREKIGESTQIPERFVKALLYAERFAVRQV